MKNQPSLLASQVCHDLAAPYAVIETIFERLKQKKLLGKYEEVAFKSLKQIEKIIDQLDSINEN